MYWRDWPLETGLRKDVWLGACQEWNENMVGSRPSAKLFTFIIGSHSLEKCENCWLQRY